MATIQVPIALVILDGWGLGKCDSENAIYQADTPHLKLLTEMYPNTQLICSGEQVGLPHGQMGNSEVGHLNIGAGRIVYQELTRITKAIHDGDFFRNPVLIDVMAKTLRSGGALHLMGLLSDGGVHSHILHLFALLELAKRQGIKQVYVHAFLDGRDVPPAGAKQYIIDLEQKMIELEIGQIATVSGRYYAMDRDKRWERVEKAYAAMVYREGNFAATAVDGLEQAYARGETDEFVIPFIIDSCTAFKGIQPGDGMVFFNFRPDRAREITRALHDDDFNGFLRRTGKVPLYFVGMTQYDETISVPAAFAPNYLHNTLGEVFSRHGLRQLRIAETEKYAHVTFFFNGGEEKPFACEDRILIPSPKVATYDLKPEMSAPEVTERVVQEIKSGKYDLIVLNFANGDMVGHTGLLNAAIQAVSTVDQCVGQVVQAMRRMGGITCITADHGNAENMGDGAGHCYTAHTTNPVPFILVSEYHRNRTLRPGILADVAPTILELANLKVPAEMTGSSLLKEDQDENEVEE